MYDRIEETETLLIDARARKRAIEADKVRGDNIYRILTHFDKLYDVMSDSERQELMQSLIAEIQINEEPLPNGQWIKSIRFRLPIIDGDTALTLDKCDGVETVLSMSQQKPDDVIQVGIDLDDMDVTPAESKASYSEIKDYVFQQTGLKVSCLYIAQVKAKHGITERECYNKPKTEGNRVPKCPPEKEKAIEDALMHFQMLTDI